ncbi:MAG TPA: MotA/TolQ/ExbB proton channel family protein [Anaeromyxobacter sp.]|nr:MotA/TolQ/ExbB proton channel family protein [Anaeromyxobacter sp.]
MTKQLLDLFTRAGAEWVTWALAALSVACAAVITDRALWFGRGGRSRSATVIPLLAWGKLEQARLEVEDQAGLEAEVVRAAVDAAEDGSASVAETVACTIRRERAGYERGLGFLRGLGASAPLLGLFGAVVGVIRAFAETGAATANGAGAVDLAPAISVALVPAALGMLAAIPAVAAFHAYRRRLERMVTRAEALGHALASVLQRDVVRSAALARARVGIAPRRVKAVEAWPEPVERAQADAA